jgi:hypothetical protein
VRADATSRPMELQMLMNGHPPLRLGSESREPSLGCSEVSAAKERIAGMPCIKRTIGVIRLWPEQACAEHECVERIRTAAAMIGVQVVELDKFGHIVDSPRQRVTRDDVDFVLHLHFETAKTYDAVSVAAMWNPIQFYFDWGFNRHWSNQMSHDVYAYTGSAEVKKLVRGSRGVVVADSMPLLNHTLADPIIPPQPHDRYHAFYCGINWEKLSHRPARHDAVLRRLDRQGILDVYGPSEIRGVKLWDGYQGYKGPLPFDGRTVIGRIAESGTCLVFSSEAHMRSGIMSNRLFEAMAAGAVVIGDEHPFIPRAIGDNFVHVPSSLTAEDRARRIGDALARFNRHPEEAVAMAKASQKALISSYHLCSQLADVYEAVRNFVERSTASTPTANASVVDFVIQPLVGDADVLRRQIDRLVQGSSGRARVILLVDAKHARWYDQIVDDAVRIVPVAGTLGRMLSPGEMIEHAGPWLTSPKVTFLCGIEELFIETFLTACREGGSHPVARVGHVLRHQNANGDVFYDYARGASELHLLHDSALGCVIFDRVWLSQNVPVRDLSWKDVCRIAELQCQSVVDCPATSAVIDITEYERILNRITSPPSAELDPEVLMLLANPVRETIASNATVVARLPVTSTAPVRAFSQEHLLTSVLGMDQEKRWKLLLNLYHAVPMPAWLRSTITMMRRAVGIR